MAHEEYRLSNVAFSRLFDVLQPPPPLTCSLLYVCATLDHYGCRHNDILRTVVVEGHFNLRRFSIDAENLMVSVPQLSLLYFCTVVRSVQTHVKYLVIWLTVHKLKFYLLSLHCLLLLMIYWILMVFGTYCIHGIVLEWSILKLFNDSQISRVT